MPKRPVAEALVHRLRWTKPRSGHGLAERPSTTHLSAVDRRSLPMRRAWLALLLVLFALPALGRGDRLGRLSLQVARPQRQDRGPGVRRSRGAGRHLLHEPCPHRRHQGRDRAGRGSGRGVDRLPPGRADRHQQARQAQEPARGVQRARLVHLQEHPGDALLGRQAQARWSTSSTPTASSKAARATRSASCRSASGRSFAGGPRDTPGSALSCSSGPEDMSDTESAVRCKEKSSEQHPAGGFRAADERRRVVPERQAVGGHGRRSRDGDDLAEMAGSAVDQPLVRDARRAEAEMQVDVARAARRRSPGW